MLNENINMNIEPSKFATNKFETTAYMTDYYSTYSQVFSHVIKHFGNKFREYGIDINKVELPRSSKTYQDKHSTEKEKIERKFPLCIAIHEKDGLEEVTKIAGLDESYRMKMVQHNLVNVRYRGKSEYVYSYFDGTNFKITANENMYNLNGLVSMIFESEIDAYNFFRKVKSDFPEEHIIPFCEFYTDSKLTKIAYPYTVDFCIPDAIIGSVALNMSEMFNIPVEDITGTDIISFLSTYSEYEFSIAVNPANNKPQIIVTVPRSIDVKITSITKGTDSESFGEGVKIEFVILYSEFVRMNLYSIYTNKLNKDYKENLYDISKGKVIDTFYKPKISESINGTYHNTELSFRYTKDDINKKGNLTYDISNLILSHNPSILEFIEYFLDGNKEMYDKFKFYKYFTFEIKRKNIRNEEYTNSNDKHLFVNTNELTITDTYTRIEEGDELILIIYLNLKELKKYHKNVVLGDLSKINKDISRINGSELINCILLR